VEQRGSLTPRHLRARARAQAHLAESERVVVHAPGIINRQSVFVPGVLDRADPRVRPPPRPGLPFPAPLL